MATQATDPTPKSNQTLAPLILYESHELKPSLPEPHARRHHHNHHKPPPPPLPPPLNP